MRCNSCGRELQNGQMFCQCGATVGYSGTDALNLYPEKKKSALPLLIGMGAGALIFVVIIVLVVSAATKGKRSVTDRSKWERLTGTGFSMTVPSGMTDGEVVTKSAELNTLKQMHNSEVAIAVSSYAYDAKKLGSINRKKLQEMIQKQMPTKDSNGHEINLQERGGYFYYDYEHEQSGIFFGANSVHVVDAMFVGKSAVYDVVVFCPEKKYSEYEPYIFSWVDSFQGE
ncbi:MAG: hypothetical protein K5695_14290 [Oscillospiraceae bacterium]|nr:hypothetical protein [Oscillospiraceae bacterium]